MDLEQFIARLMGKLALQITDANNQGNREGAHTLQRILNALEATMVEAQAEAAAAAAAEAAEQEKEAE